jgi:hypothetical protein
LTYHFTFNIRGNRLSGPVPAFTDQSRLMYFSIDDNELSGNLPDPTVLEKIESARVCPNRFNPVPSEAWDILTRTRPWYRDCLPPPPEQIFGDGFDG